MIGKLARVSDQSRCEGPKEQEGGNNPEHVAVHAQVNDAPKRAFRNHSLAAFTMASRAFARPLLWQPDIGHRLRVMYLPSPGFDRRSRIRNHTPCSCWDQVFGHPNAFFRPP